MIFKQIPEIINGQKTQTRRLWKPDYSIDMHNGQIRQINHKGRAKYYLGQVLAVQPKMYHPTVIYHDDHPCYGIDIIQPNDPHYSHVREGDWRPEGQGYKYLHIKIKRLRREHLQDISEEDAIAEGIWHLEPTISLPDYETGETRPLPGGYTTSTLPVGDVYSTAVEGYKHLWNQINTSKKTNWDANPLVLVIEFERVK